MRLDPIPSDTPADDDGLGEILPPLCAVFRQHLRKGGLKYTPERAQILDTIIHIDGLFEADSLVERFRGEQGEQSGGHSGVSKATSYRTLKLLEEAGIIQRVPLEREQIHYQLVYGKKANTLIVDVESGEVEAIDTPELAALRDRLCRERGVVADGYRLQIFVRKA